jgi:hypothetical protein
LILNDRSGIYAHSLISVASREVIKGLRGGHFNTYFQHHETALQSGSGRSCTVLLLSRSGFLHGIMLVAITPLSELNPTTVYSSINQSIKYEFEEITGL